MAHLSVTDNPLQNLEVECQQRWCEHVDQTDNMDWVKSCIELVVGNKGQCHWQTKDIEAGLCICRLECDGYQPMGSSGPCQLEKGN